MRREVRTAVVLLSTACKDGHRRRGGNCHTSMPDGNTYRRKETRKMSTVISYGGGVQSTALVVLAVREQWSVDEIVHVDLLDAESPETRRYVAYLTQWLWDTHGRAITIIERDLYGDMLKQDRKSTRLNSSH